MPPQSGTRAPHPADGPLLPVIEREFDLLHGEAGSLYFFLTLGSCVGLCLSGYVAWRLSHRATIAVSGITLGMALLAIACTPSLFWIRADLVLLGLGAGLYLPSGVAVLTENTREGAWGTALAIHELGPNLGYICAPLLAELLLGVFAWRGVLGAFGGPAILLSGIFWLSGLGGSARAHRPSGAAIARLARTGSFWGVAGLFAVSFYPAGFSLLSSVFPLPIRNVAVSMVLILATLVGAGGVPPLIGFLADHFSFALAFGAAGAATLAILVPLGRVLSRSEIA